MTAIAFVWVERKAAEPVMPLAMFRNKNFNLVTAAGLLTGIAMFGALAYMPTYLQMVAGVDATRAGLLMIPMMGALLVTAIGSGRAVTRTGKYKMFPIVGSVFIGASLGLLSTLTVATPLWLVCTYLAFMGIGLGLTMQILILDCAELVPARDGGHGDGVEQLLPADRRLARRRDRRFAVHRAPDQPVGRAPSGRRRQRRPELAHA